MATTDETATTSPVEHHQYYKYGTRTEEWVQTEYDLAWFWESPDKLPVSPNCHSPWETAFSDQVIGQSELAHFKQHAVPITAEEYKALMDNKADMQDQDDFLEYMWGNPWEYLEDD